MPALISNIIDLVATQAEVDALLVQVRSVAKEVKSIKPISLKVESNSPATEIAKVTVEVQNLSAELAKSEAKWKQAISERKRLDSEMAKAFQQNKRLEIAGSKEALQIEKATEQERKRLIAERKAADAQARKEFQQNRKQEVAANKEAIALQKETAKQTQLLENEYKQLSMALNDARTRYYNLYLVAGKNNQATKDAQREVDALAKALSEMRQSAGDFGGNVGNYQGALNGLQFSVRNIVSELPNLGISLRTFGQSISNNLTPLVESIKSVVEQNRLLRAEGKPTQSVLKALGQSFFSLSTVVSLVIIAGLKLIEYFDQQKKQANEYSDALKQASTQAQVFARQEINQLTLLTKVAQDNTRSIKDREMAVRELQSQFPYYFANLSKEEIMYGNISNAIRTATVDLLNNAKAQAYAAQANVSAEEFVKQETALREAERAAAKYYLENEKLIKQQERQAAFAATQGSNPRSSGVTPTRQFAEYQRLKQVEKEAFNATISAQSDILKYQDLALRNQIRLGSVETEKAKTVKDTTNAELKANEDILKSDLELYRAQVELEMAKRKVIFEDETKGLEDRLQAHREFISLRQSLILAESDAEKEGLQNRLNEISKIELIAEDKRSNEQKKLLLNKENYLKQVKNLDERYAFDGQTAEVEGIKEQNNIIENDLQNRLKTFDSYWQQIVNREKSVANERIASQLRLLKNGEINERTYNQKRQQIITQSANRINEVLGNELQATIDYFSKQLSDPNLPEETRKAAEAIVNAAKTELAKLTEGRVSGRTSPSILNLLGFGSDPNATPEQIEEQAKREISQLIQGLYQTLFNAIDAARQNYWENQFNALDAEAERIKRNAEIEKQSIEDSLKNQEEKAALLQELDNRTLAAERANDEKRKQYQRQQAQAEKRDAIFKAGLDGSLAVIKAFATYPYPASLAIAGLVAAQTAASIAIIASKPIPQYKMGTDNHKGGLAIVGDGGKQEVIQEPGKSPFLSPDIATMMPLAKGTKVYKDVNTYIQKRAINNYAQYAAKNDANMTMAIAEFIADKFDKTGNKFVGAIKKMPRVSSANGRDTYETAQGRTEYINRMMGK